MQAGLSLKALALVAGSLVAGSALAQIRYSVTEVPPLPGSTDSYAAAINDYGVVVGSCSSSNGSGSMATVWRDGVPSALGLIRRGNYSSATAINNAGVIAGEADDGDFRPNVVTFTGGVATFIDSGANNSHAVKVTTSGQVIGDYLKGFGGTSAWNPTIWSVDKPGRYKHTFLPQYVDPTGGFSSVYAHGANNQGVVVGQVNSTQWSSRAGLWTNDSKHTLTLLDPLPGQWDSYAFGINDSGVTVGISDVGTFSTTPVTWSPSGQVQALPLFPGEIHGYATGINNLGQVIGWHGTGGQPAVWINGEIVDVQSALDASGAGWTISTLSGINNAGQIVGGGFHNGQFRGFVLTPAGIRP